MNSAIRKRLWQPWAIRPEALSAIAEQPDHSMPSAGIFEEMMSFLGITPPQMYMDGDTAVIQVHGVLAPDVSQYEMFAGLIDTNDVAALAREAADDPDVAAIRFDIDSPGGVVTGIPELAEFVRSIDKPTTAYTAGMMCSAAYWLGAACDEIVASSSADVGSIGVYIAAADYSQAAEDAGVKVHLVRSGDLKGMGVPGTPITEEHLAHLQAEVNALFGEFVDHVQLGRDRTIDPQYLRGQSIRASVAVDAGLVDTIRNPHLMEAGMFGANDKAARAAMAELEDENASLRAKADELADKLADAAAKIQELEAAHAKAVDLLNVASQTIDQREDRIAELMADVDELKDALANPAAEYAEATEGTDPVADTSGSDGDGDPQTVYAQLCKEGRFVEAREYYLKTRGEK